MRPSPAAAARSIDPSLRQPSWRLLDPDIAAYIRLQPVRSAADWWDCGAIRHAVYAIEHGYEPLREDGIETDVDDDRALAMLLRRRADGGAIGCVRLILPGLDPVPGLAACGRVIDGEALADLGLEPEALAEISRLAVLRSERLARPQLVLALLLGVAALLRASAAPGALLLAEERLIAFLASLGLPLHPVGSPIEHRGRRRPMVLLQRELLRMDAAAERIRSALAELGVELDSDLHLIRRPGLGRCA